jgi:type II secretory pathway pseudopilin PulG
MVVVVVVGVVAAVIVVVVADAKKIRNQAHLRYSLLH